MANRLARVTLAIRAILTPRHRSSREIRLDREGDPAMALDPCAPSSRDTAAADKGQTKRLALELHIESTRCDLHPLYVLRPIEIEIVLPAARVPTKVIASCCTKQTCIRHYVPECGYFSFGSGGPPDFAGLDSRPVCAVHEYSHMAVAKANGNFTWACLQHGCAQTAPYREPS